MESPGSSQFSDTFTRRQWRILALLVSCNFLAAIVMSLQAPFYPAEAEKKGATPTEYGFVFGIYEFVAFLACPLISSRIHKFRPIKAFSMGYIIVATSTTLFGFLDRINDHTVFLAASFALRAFEAFGGALVFISNYTFVTISFPTSIATIFAVMETAFAIGVAAGPAFGGLLFQLGGESFGFTLPFLVTGSMLFLTNPIAICVLPKVEPSGDADANSSNYRFFKLLKFPTILLYAVSVVSASLCFGFLSSTLEPHLRQFSLTPVMVGLVFLIYGGVYAIMSPILGLICDRTLEPNRVTFAGAIFILVSHMLIGPVSFLPIKPSLTLVGISLALFALGTSAIQVSAFLLMLRDALKNGFGHSAATTASVTALWLASMSLGGFIGPSVGGLLFDQYGFRIGTIFTVSLFVIISSLLFCSVLVRQDYYTTGSERISLLSSSSSSSAGTVETGEAAYQTSYSSNSTANIAAVSVGDDKFTDENRDNFPRT